MFNARRTYAYLVSAISLAAVYFAVVWLLRDVLLPGYSSLTTEKALNLAILIVGIPIYLGHWLWQQRLSMRDVEERSALGRRIYLYGVIAGMVSQITAGLYDLVSLIVGVTPVQVGSPSTPSPSNLYYLIPIAIAALVVAYHLRLVRAESHDAPDTGSAGTVRRLYIYGFSAAGMTMIALALIEFVRWILSQIGVLGFAAAPLHVEILPEIARLLVGLPLWYFYWRWANNLFHSTTEERESVLRKFYLYAAIFVGMVGMVTYAALLLTGIFRGMLGLTTEGDWRDALALIISYAALWLYHSLVLRQDLRVGEDTEQQAEMRRLYLYLLAAVGLIALVAGVIWDSYLLILILDEGLLNAHRAQIAYASAAIVAGFPVWILAWRQAQHEAGQSDTIGRQARRSITRKIYIYFFQFVSIMAVLGSAIYVVSQFVTWLLVQRQIDLTDIALPIAISIVQLLVWLYHWTTLRADRKLSADDETRNLENMSLVMLKKSGDRAVSAINNWLQKISPSSSVEAVYSDVDPKGQPPSWLANTLERVAHAETIVVPWTIFMPQPEDGVEAHQLAQAIVASPAQKLLLPVASPGWNWVGMETVAEEKLAQEAVEMLRQLANGEKPRSGRKLGCGVIGVIVLGVLLLLLIVPSVYFFFMM